jgi:hypothetical protein
MKRSVLGRTAAQLAACLALLTACNAEAPQSQGTSQVTAGEWIDLFNGENLDGWRSYGAGGTLNPQWIVEDGAIVLNVDEDTDETTGGDLITVEQYENFELELEWKISAGGNSGIFFGVREIPDLDVAYDTGIEMQVLDDDRHVDGRTPETSAGACYALYPPTGKVLRPVGEYNRVRLVVNGGHVEHWLNGRKIVEYVIGSDDWNERIAASKFADWKHFARYRKGYIGLQDHTDRVWFRNIRLREL